MWWLFLVWCWWMCCPGCVHLLVIIKRSLRQDEGYPDRPRELCWSRFSGRKNHGASGPLWKLHHYQTRLIMLIFSCVLCVHCHWAQHSTQQLRCHKWGPQPVWTRRGSPSFEELWVLKVELTCPSWLTSCSSFWGHRDLYQRISSKFKPSFYAPRAPGNDT
jgi:hypothetical protein